MWPVRKRVLWMVVLWLLVAGLSPASARSRPGSKALGWAGPSRPELFRDMYARGFSPGVTGEIALVPRAGLAWCDAASQFDHGTPWDYDIHVPLLFYGPDLIHAGRIDRLSRPQDLTVTVARALAVPPLPAADGHAWEDVLVRGAAPPRVVVMLVLDQVGYHHLAEHLALMPNLARMVQKGAWFTQCRLDYLPSSTGVSHATVGSGSSPGIHGVANNSIPDPAGGMRNVWADGPDRLNPRALLIPTLADRVDQHHGNRSVVIGHVTAGYAVGGLVGHGLSYPGGDRDILFFYSSARRRFVTDDRYYAMPAYVGSRALLDSRLAAKYARLGLKKPFHKGATVLPEIARAGADAVLEAMLREGVGRDKIPDLVLLNLKTTDYVGHELGQDHPFFREALLEIDRFLGRAEALVHQRAGPGGYLFAMTADHGACPVDGLRIDRTRWARELGEQLDRRGDRDGKNAVQGIDACLLYVDRKELAQEGYSLERLRDRIRSDPAVEAAWTVDELALRQCELRASGRSRAATDPGCGPGVRPR